MDYHFSVKGLKAPAEEAYMTCFLNRTTYEMGRRFRKAVIVCPGGSYATLSEREGEPVAIRFQSYGAQSFVLHYSVEHKPYPTALLQAAAAVAAVRRNAKIWDIDPNGIVLCGFSAGGHLAASLAALWNDPLLAGLYPDGECRPNGAILCYPIVTAAEPWRERRFLEQLCAEENEETLSGLSVEKRVGAGMPPCFIWHNADDQEVPVMNSLLLMRALSQNDVSFEAHIFPTGGHGLSLADDTVATTEMGINEDCARWPELAWRWIHRI